MYENNHDDIERHWKFSSQVENKSITKKMYVERS